MPIMSYKKTFQKGCFLKIPSFFALHFEIPLAYSNFMIPITTHACFKLVITVH